MNVDVEYLEFMWSMRHFLITCGDIEGKSNIIAVSFCMPVSKEPPLLACAIGKKSCSSELIRNSKEFIVNVPHAELKPQIYYCGLCATTSAEALHFRAGLEYPVDVDHAAA